jgi:hypothetical protein
MLLYSYCPYPIWQVALHLLERRRKTADEAPPPEDGPPTGARASEKSQGVNSTAERPNNRSSSLDGPTTAIVLGTGSSNPPFHRCLDEARWPVNLLRKQASPYPALGVGKTSDRGEGW